MIRSWFYLVIFLLALSSVDLYAETYSWTDAQGTVHFTEDPGRIPNALREKVRRVDEPELSREGEPAAGSSGKSRDATPKAIPPVGRDESASDELYGGRTYAEWEKDLSDREVALTSLRKRIDELAAILSSADKGPRQRSLLAEHTSLVAEFREKKAEYFRQVEIARKAGLQINIQQ